MDDVCVFLRDKKGSLDVVLQNEKAGADLLRSLRDTFPGQVEISKLNEQKVSAALSLPVKAVPNFAVTSTGYRFEESDADMSDHKVFAKINFGDAKGCSQLKQIFSKLKTKLSDPL